MSFYYLPCVVSLHYSFNFEFDQLSKFIEKLLFLSIYKPYLINLYYFVFEGWGPYAYFEILDKSTGGHNTTNAGSQYNPTRNSLPRDGSSAIVELEAVMLTICND
jgi:hypothetical protein